MKILRFVDLLRNGLFLLGLHNGEDWFSFLLVENISEIAFASACVVFSTLDRILAAVTQLCSTASLHV